MESLSIKKLFRLAGQFVIPSYQRAYSWESHQYEQFIEDLRDCNGSYYLGHFLFEESKDSEVMYLIDGQQRMTTIIIFFSSLLHAISAKDNKNLPNKFCDIIRRLYIRDDITGSQKFKTVDYDNTFFIKEIIDRDENSFNENLNTSSQRRIRECRIYFDNVFKNEDIDTLYKWAEIIENAQVTEFQVKTKADAAQIFAFQNDRGKPLSNLEVLKSFFMLQVYLREPLPKKQEEQITRLYESFEEIYKVIVNINIHEDDILRYFWMAYSTKGFRTENTLQEIKCYFKDKSKNISDILNFMDSLSSAYKQVLMIERDENFDMMNLKRLNNMALSYPILIKARVIAHVSPNTNNRLVKLLENITFRSAARGGRAAISTRLNFLLTNSTNDQNFNDNISNFITRMRYDYWNDDELRNNLNSGYIFSRHKICSYLLWRYEQYLCPSDYPAPRVNWKDICKKESLEHIAPQNPQNGDPIALGYGEYVDLEKPENGIQSGHWLNSIGNLLLMSQSQNSAVGNKDFNDVKLVSYYGKDSLIRQQHEILDFVDDKENPRWTKSAIEKRGNHIIDIAVKYIWNFDNI